MDCKLTQEQIEIVVERGARSLFEYCRKYGIHYLVTGVSGGLDSAVTLGFAQRACQMAEKEAFVLISVGLIMPCHSKHEAEELAEQAIKRFGAEKLHINLTDIYNYIDYYFLRMVPSFNNQIKNISKKMGGDFDQERWHRSLSIAGGNIKARLRMTLGTYHTAKMLGGIVLSTDNLSEYWMAFWTIHGDVGDFGIIQNITKGLELYDIAEYLDVPKGIRDAKPDDGLGISGGDEDQLGAAYPVIDKIMISLIRQGFDPDGPLNQLDNLPVIPGIAEETVKKIAERSLKGAYKRKGAIMLSREDLGLPPIK